MRVFFVKAKGLSLLQDIFFFFFIGGTLGLFTGISVLSVIEAGYWVIRIVIAIARNVFRAVKN